MQQRSTALRFHTRGKTFEIENIRAISYYTGLLEFRSTDGRIDFQITCDNDKYLADQLEAWAAKIRGRTVADAAEPGIIRADSAAPPATFDRRPTLADVPAGDPLTAWRMIYYRFRDHENEAVREIAYAAAEEYQALVGNNNKAAKGAAAIEAAAAPEPEALTQLEQDLAVCGPEMAAILSAEYPQATIQRILGLKANAGSYRQRILDVLDALGGGEMEAAA